MKEIKKILIILISFALLLSLASCSQGKINEDRLPGGVPGGTEAGPNDGPQTPTGGVQDGPEPNNGTQAPTNGGSQEEVTPPGLDDYIDVEDSTFEDARHGEGEGTVLYTVTSVGLYDSLEAAGISEESYAASGEEKYDHYVKINMTVKNVDISDTGKECTANSFQLAGHVYFEPVWFSLGGMADDGGRGYFHFYLPPAGEALEISIAWGLADSELTELRDAGDIWLTYNINIWQKMKLEGLL